MSYVYVFNLRGETMETLSINGLQVNSILAWSAGDAGEPPRFTPFREPVARVVNPDPGKFHNGDNTVIFQWPSGTFIFNVTIDAVRFPITQELLLFVTQNRWFLETQFGAVAEEGEVLPLGAFGLTLKDVC